METVVPLGFGGGKLHGVRLQNDGVGIEGRMRAAHETGRFEVTACDLGADNWSRVRRQIRVGARRLRQLADGAEAYMHMRALGAAGSRRVAAGTRLKVTIEETLKARQVARVLEVGDADLKSRSRGGQRGAMATGTNPMLTTEGTVKWYNAEKGFGFIAPANGGRDIFVHATASTRSGLRGLVDGQKVVIECGQGKKGVEARSVGLDWPTAPPWIE